MSPDPNVDASRFFVLTGGPSSGKTTLLGALAQRGHAVVEEAALTIIHGDSSRQLRADPLEFQKRILRLQIAREMSVVPTTSGLVFTDRGIGDHFAYLRLRGVPAFPELEAAWELACRRYETVFLLEPGPEYTPTLDRTETPEEAHAVHLAIAQEYRKRHPRVVEIPWEPLVRRVELVLEAVARRPAETPARSPTLLHRLRRYDYHGAMGAKQTSSQDSAIGMKNIGHEMCFVIQRSHSLREILDNAVQLIAREMGTDVCSIYLLDPRDHRLRLMATQGLDKAALGKVRLALGEGLTGTVVKEMRSLAVEDASTHPAFRYFPETKDEQFHSFLGVPLAIRNRPVGAIVIQTRERRSYSREDVQTLTTISAQLVGVVENARLIDALDHGEEGVPYLHEVRSWRTLGQVAPHERQENLTLRGSPASPGIAVGVALFRGSHDLSFSVPELPFQGAEKEMERVVDAFDETRKDILKIQQAAEREAGEEHALIFSSHLLLLNDPVLMDRIAGAVRQGVAAPGAIYDAFEHFGNKLQNVPDPYIQDRVEDIRDLRSRILDQILRAKSQSSTMSDKIVVARGIPPSLVVELKAEGARGIITERGGPTSHGALLARSMGVPAVTGIVDIVLTVRSGDTLIIDGGTGKVIVTPSKATLDEYEHTAERLRRRRASNLRFRALPARTKDGTEVSLQANIGVAADLALARENGAQGIGLYRTEFPFLIREDFPTQEEQIRIYQKAYEYFPQGPVHFRLLDLGGDKFLPRNTLEPDRNPFRGYRSIRVLLQNPAILQGQVQAFVRAAGSRPLGILIPMVSSVPELKAALKNIREAIDAIEEPDVNRSPSIGAMIEVPAAVELATEIARDVDFFSIGSNDLIQYTLAVDRENERAGNKNDPFHPAVLRLIRRTIQAGHALGREVALCGEIASRPRVALALVAMGIDALSLTPDAIPEIKRALACTEIGALRNEIDAVLALGDAAEVEETLKRHLPLEDGEP
jgi:phosphotransferase system enzyme I (PtsP)